jgi:predicted ATPase
LRTSLEQSPEASYQPYFTWFLGELAQGLGWAGQIAQGLETIDEALARSERNEDRWCVAELLRIKGELLLLQRGSGTAAAAEDHYQQALGWARRQGALSWELRTATSLARLLRDQYRSTEAMALLAPIYNRFTEGFETADLKTAKALIDSLPLRAGARRDEAT